MDQTMNNGMSSDFQFGAIVLQNEIGSAPIFFTLKDKQSQIEQFELTLTNLPECATLTIFPLLSSHPQQQQQAQYIAHIFLADLPFDQRDFQCYNEIVLAPGGGDQGGPIPNDEKLNNSVCIRLVNKRSVRIRIVVQPWSQQQHHRYRETPESSIHSIYEYSLTLADSLATVMDNAEKYSVLYKSFHDTVGTLNTMEDHARQHFLTKVNDLLRECAAMVQTPLPQSVGLDPHAKTDQLLQWAEAMLAQIKGIYTKGSEQ
eukprot:GEZU01002524.1.p1 GENE.GEZU01002524.1~~GEZU01002524.1.p1  ORF type:complete len:259 (-),score=48.69 GEZU01002524.1:69-845(-)